MLYSSWYVMLLMLIALPSGALHGKPSWPSLKKQREIVELLGGQGSFDKYKKKDNHKTSPMIVFISSSMKYELILDVLQQAKKYKAHVVMRGFIDGSYKKTVSYLKPFIEKTKGGVEISPGLFKRYKIKRVPTLVVMCPIGFDAVPGATSLKHGTNRVLQEGDCGPFLNKHLKTFQNGGMH